MNPEQATPTLRFLREFSDQEAFEAQGRGYLSHVLVQLGEGRLYPLFFYDAIRLQQDLEESAKHGRPFVADPGMIVLPEITLDAMKQAVEQLSGEGFFDHLTPLTEDDLVAADAFAWPPQRRQVKSGTTARSRKSSKNVRSGKTVRNQT
jgi:hypothetical protein